MAGPAPKNRDLSRHHLGFQHGCIAAFAATAGAGSSKFCAAMTTICSV
ncbi:hypothetical protein CORC01_04962 [Colletotrichum orchidophilum]|uniref:Uncharacterized protein n=1 Tax=Colletotrichum orchidophilum TaxID=1209926 RepID=A0A1G4BER8_9PEZI|nr:uncharacterized protein CORC01_04962 [Colletotrichum orchidophilum]OHE99826.1 hypothetical protein CORC01_04962 [Colletotrichum orchidophilum]